MDGNTHGKTGRNHVENDDDGPVVDAEPISDLLDIPADEVSNRIGQGTIRTLCESGVDEHPRRVSPEVFSPQLLRPHRGRSRRTGFQSHIY
ncbi:MAG: DUF6522 family protein [Anderseniella sp.]